MTRKDQADEFMGFELVGRPACPPGEILRLIGEAIRLGRHKPGQGLPPTEAALASSFRVSYNVREAIAGFRSCGLVPAGSRRSLGRGAAGFRIAPDSLNEPAPTAISACDPIALRDAMCVHLTEAAARLGLRMGPAEST